MWRIVIPNWIPPYLNTARGRHWNKSAANTRAVADMVKVYALKAGVPLVTDAYRPRRKVTIDEAKYGKLPDPDNLLKHTLDGLKLARLIVDDSAKWCEWERPTLERLTGPVRPGWGTVIILADLTEPLPVVHTEQAGGVTFTRAVVRERHWHADEPLSFPVARPAAVRPDPDLFG